LLVLRGASVAEIILDTAPGGYRLTDAAVEEIAALFNRLNPSGRNWSITNNCLAVIRRVPGVASRGCGRGPGPDRQPLPG